VSRRDRRDAPRSSRATAGYRAPMEAVWPVLGVVVGAVAILVAAVWLGRTMVAPRIGRALDRANADEEEPRDRSD
jgi:hypothetical protein